MPIGRYRLLLISNGLTLALAGRDAASYAAKEWVFISVTRSSCDSEFFSRSCARRRDAAPLKMALLRTDLVAAIACWTAMANILWTGPLADLPTKCRRRTIVRWKLTAFRRSLQATQL